MVLRGLTYASPVLRLLVVDKRLLDADGVLVAVSC